VAAPGATAVTRPFDDTVATAFALDVQLTAWPVTGVPLASVGVALSCAVAFGTRVADPGEIATDATRGGAVVPPLSLPPPLQATSRESVVHRKAVAHVVRIVSTSLCRRPRREAQGAVW